MIEEHVKRALIEDIGFEDITADNLTGENDTLECVLNTRCDGVFCGRDVFKTVFELLDKDINIDIELINKNSKELTADTDTDTKSLLKKIFNMLAIILQRMN